MVNSVSRNEDAFLSGSNSFRSSPPLLPPSSLRLPPLRILSTHSRLIPSGKCRSSRCPSRQGRPVHSVSPQYRFSSWVEPGRPSPLIRGASWDLQFPAASALLLAEGSGTLIRPPAPRIVMTSRAWRPLGYAVVLRECSQPPRLRLQDDTSQGSERRRAESRAGR